MLLFYFQVCMLKSALWLHRCPMFIAIMIFIISEADALYVFEHATFILKVLYAVFFGGAMVALVAKAQPLGAFRSNHREGRCAGWDKISLRCLCDLEAD